MQTFLFYFIFYKCVKAISKLLTSNAKDIHFNKIYTLNKQYILGDTKSIKLKINIIFLNEKLC